MKKVRVSGFSFYLILMVVVFAILYITSGSKTSSYTWKNFTDAMSSGKVTAVVISQNEQVPTGSAVVQLNDKTQAKLYVSDVNELQAMLREAEVNYSLGDVPQSGWIEELLPTLIVVAAVFILMTLMMNGGQSSSVNAKMMNFGKSRATMTNKNDVKTRFKDVAGLQEEKEEVEELVDFLKDPKKYTANGARIPKGIILVGPPGTGKTLLAKAVAGEAGVPFFSISGSDFVEMFVGVGASRVRDLFSDAKAHAPCIVFIDEIDAVARKRGTGMGGGHDEREQTLNQMLVEMDGFGVNEGIIVMAATNRVDILDPAILRPGRFDRQVYVGKPDVEGRRQILKVHSDTKPLAEDVDLDQIARTTSGFTGADLENLLNEAAILSAKENRKFITQDDIKRSFVKIGIGTEKKSKIVTEKDKKVTAYHESGHAILMHKLEEAGPVYTVSIIPTGASAAGYTMPLPERDDMHVTKNRMFSEIVVSLGGRVAESLIFDDITTGASADIRRATQIARDMVTKYGFSDAIGPINYGSDEEEVFIGRDLAHTKSYSEGVQQSIDSEVKRIIDEAYAKAKEIITENMDVLHASTNLLLEKEKISREEFEGLFHD